MTSILAEWPLEREPLTLGSMLVFRQELELFAKSSGRNRVKIYFTAQGGLVRMLPAYVDEVLQSRIPFEIVQEDPLPTCFDWSDTRGPYSSLRRIPLLQEQASAEVCLEWSGAVLQQAIDFAVSVKAAHGRICCVHLKQQGDNPLESNANLRAWLQFFAEVPLHSKIAFALLGDDPLLDEFDEVEGVFSARKKGIPLRVQLALCSIADGFLGMASGVCQAAIFSRTPYVIFKHPLHHVDEMNAELGSRDRFPFSDDKQCFWRIVDDPSTLWEAFRLLFPSL